MKKAFLTFAISFLVLAFIRLFVENGINRIALVNIDWLKFFGIVVISSAIITFTIRVILIPRNKRHQLIYQGVTVPKQNGIIGWLLSVIEITLSWTALTLDFGNMKPTIKENIFYLLFIGVFMGSMNFFMRPLNNSKRYVERRLQKK